MAVGATEPAISLSASSFYALHSPSACERRVYLDAHGAPRAAKDPYDETLRALGKRHEAAHLATLGPYEDLSQLPPEQRVRGTLDAIRRRVDVIYHPRFEVEVVLGRVPCIVVGEPDFLIRRQDSYVIRDAKMARRIAEHPEILRQIETYGWLYEEALGASPLALEAVNGASEVVEIAPAIAGAVIAALTALVELKTAPGEPYSPVGWTKCGSCPFHETCWTRAEAGHDVALIPKVDQGLAIQLRRDGVTTREQLLARFDQDSLSAYQRPWGAKTQRVGKAAATILRSAHAMRDSRHIVLQAPALPASESFIVFDLEGLPPHLDELDKVFLWGLQVFGKHETLYRGVTAGFGLDGDREGWSRFLEAADAVLREHGDIPWVHWASYERTKLDAYIARFGDPSGIAERVKHNLRDLLPITQTAVVLPLPSYSLKVVEGYVGFKRTQDEYGGTWAMAKFIEATECAREQERDRLVDEILKYNEEDLQATWAVLKWLRTLTPEA